jgi:hypothetical protein
VCKTVGSVGSSFLITFKMESLLEERQSKLGRIEILNAFITSLEDKEAVIDEFSTDLWNLMIQDALVNEDGSITFKFRNGNEVRI